MKVNT